MTCYCKDSLIQDKIQQLAREGWHVCKTGSGHTKLVSPNGRPIFISSTPSDRRARHNILALIKREETAQGGK